MGNGAPPASHSALFGDPVFMKKHLICLAAALAVAGSNRASAQIAIDNPTIALALSNADIVAGTGSASWGHRAMGVAPDGSLVLVGTGVPSFGMWHVDMSGAPVYTQVATDVELLAQLAGHAGVDCNGVAVATDGTIYASFFAGADTVLEVVPGAPATITPIRTQDGIGTIRLSMDESALYITEIMNFGATGNQLTTLPLTGGAESVLISAANVTAISGAAGASFGPMDVDVDGDLVFFDELSFGGSDGLFRFPEGGPLGAILGAGDFPAGPGVNAVAVDDLGNIFMWDEFGAGFLDSVLILGADGTTFHRIPQADIATATGLSNFELKTLHAHTVSPTSVIVYGSDDESDGVISFTFGDAPAATSEWTMFE